MRTTRYDGISCIARRSAHENDIIRLIFLRHCHPICSFLLLDNCSKTADLSMISIESWAQSEERQRQRRRLFSSQRIDWINWLWLFYSGSSIISGCSFKVKFSPSRCTPPAIRLPFRNNNGTVLSAWFEELHCYLQTQCLCLPSLSNIASNQFQTYSMALSILVWSFQWHRHTL